MGKTSEEKATKQKHTRSRYMLAELSFPRTHTYLYDVDVLCTVGRSNGESDDQDIPTASYPSVAFYGSIRALEIIL